MVPENNFPLTTREFLGKGDAFLRRGDIVLSRSPTLTSWLIRKATGSYFSHAALVFLVPQPDEGFNSTFVLESTSAGVGLANLRDYISGKRPKAELVVVRLLNPALGEAYYKQVRGLMLDHVKSGYDFGKVVKLSLSLFFGMRLGWSRLRLGSRHSMRDAVDRTHRRFTKWVPPQFICSGFIQYGLVKAAVRMDLDVRSVIFREGLDVQSGDALLAATPEDIATSSKVQWLFVARRGWVHEASSYDAAKRIISGGK